MCRESFHSVTRDGSCEPLKRHRQHEQFRKLDKRLYRKHHEIWNYAFNAKTQPETFLRNQEQDRIPTPVEQAPADKQRQGKNLSVFVGKPFVKQRIDVFLRANGVRDWRRRRNLRRAIWRSVRDEERAMVEAMDIDIGVEDFDWDAYELKGDQYTLHGALDNTLWNEQTEDDVKKLCAQVPDEGPSGYPDSEFGDQSQVSFDYN